MLARGDAAEGRSERSLSSPDELVAVVYQIGGRHRTTEGAEREVYASELADPDDGSIPDDKAGAAYRQRIATRALRRAGG